MPSREFDFDAVIDRRASASSKWNRYAGGDVIPMWVADMDFRTAPCVVAELERRVAHGVFGYTDPPAELPGVVAAAMARDFGWRIEPDWIVWLPSLVVGLNVVARAFAGPGEAVLTATPIYPPFLSAPRHGGRGVVQVPLIEDGGRWCWDFDALERAVTPAVRVLLLCSPHNPTGRMWTREELTRIAQIAMRHDLVIVADEIHAGLALDADRRHLPLAGLDPAIAQRTVTLQSASKTWNIPGLGCAFAVVSDPPLRARMHGVMAGIVADPGAMGLFAALAAYRDGEPWRRALVAYLRGNRDRLERALESLPGLRSWHVEATYLAWIDMRALALEAPVRHFEAHGVGLHDGALFAAPGFARLNFACPRVLLDEALARMRRALDGI